MPTDSTAAAPFRVRHDDDELPIDFDPADFPTAADVIANIATWPDEADWIVPGIFNRFEVWQNGAMVATARRHPVSGEYNEGPPFDERGGFPPRVADLFERFASAPRSNSDSA